jgi:hypothetical protein
MAYFYDCGPHGGGKYCMAARIGMDQDHCISAKDVNFAVTDCFKKGRRRT